MTISKLLSILAKTILYIALVLLFLVVIVSFATHMTGGGRAMIGNYSFGVVATGSMEPEIQTGSFILIEKIAPEDIKIGDVLTFRSSDPTVPNGIPVTHKVIDISYDDQGSRIFTTKGTANDEQDEYPVYDEDIYGKVMFCSKSIGALVRFTQSPWLFPFLIVVLVINLIFSFVSVVKEAKNYKEQQTE